VGHRASYAVKERGELRFGSDRWDALLIPEQVAWGPAAFLLELESKRPVDGLMDEVWCEGGAAMDLDARQLVFFGGQALRAHAGLRDAFLLLVRASWPGWQVRWAHDGVVDLADAIGVDRLSLEQEADRRLTWGVDDFAGVRAAQPGDEQILLTRMGPSPTHAAFDAVADVEHVLGIGPAMLAELERRPLAPLPRERGVSQGAVIDEAAKHISYWYSFPERDRAAELAARWPGWRLERIRGGYREHLTRARLDGEGLWLSRDEVLPFAPPSTPEHAQRVLENRAALGADAPRFHPVVERFLEQLGDEEVRRERLLAAWSAGFPAAT